MRGPDKTLLDDPDLLLAWLNDLWKFVELSSCKIKVGTYTGDDSETQAITGIGFQPKYVKIWARPGAEGNTTIIEKVDDSWADYAIAHTVVATSEHYIFADAINSFDVDGFTVDDQGTNRFPNTNATVYTYLALG